MGKLTLYGYHLSGPVRAVQLTLKALDLPYEFVEVNLMKQEQLSEEFRAKNPQHTVPVLDDGGDYIWDSHAIMAYLVRKYAKHDSLYPKDFLKRARVDQRMHYESSVMFMGAMKGITGLLQKNVSHVPKEASDQVREVYKLLELFLKDSRNVYITGNTLTIADFSVITTLLALAAFIEIDANKYPKLTAWIKHMEQLPYYEEASGKGARALTEMFQSRTLTFEE